MTSRLLSLVTDHISRWLALIAAIGLALGLFFWWRGEETLAANVHFYATLPVLAGLFWQIIASLIRGDVGLDIVAALSMSAALGFGEPLAGNVVAMMYAGGQLLEDFAQGRARREMTALMGRVARTAMLHRDDGLKEVPITEIRPGDRLLIRQGEVLPVDGVLAEGASGLLDLSALTGESVPVAVKAHDEAMSGSASIGPAFDLLATRPAAESTYAGIVRLVAAAQSSKAPMVRMADRFAIWFLALTLVLAGLTYLLTGDAVRVLSVLVVATPCPLILAVPVALVAGLSRAAGMGTLVKGGPVLEALSRIRVAILDKTGTLTHGTADVTAIFTANGFSEEAVLRLAASLDQASGHVVAAALIRAAEKRGLPLSRPSDIREQAGSGIEGEVDGQRVAAGGLDFVAGLCDPAPLQAAARDASMAVAVAVDGRAAGLILLEDQVRADAGAVLADLRAAGIRRIVLASGDRSDVAEAVGQSLGLDRVLGGLTPSGKVEVVKAEQAHGPVMMVGDGVNDAPALAAADVGVAMGARGTASSSEAAGVVLLVDQLKPLAKAMQVARRSRVIALQSVVAGLSLSILAMIAAGFGYLKPVEGALLQEAIDVAVILNALRALR